MTTDAATPSPDNTDSAGWLPDDMWDRVRQRLPIACVDVVPVRRDSAGRIRDVGLMRRLYGGGDVWCQIGGRVRFDETLEAACDRHLRSSLEIGGSPTVEEFFVNEYFPTPRDGYGVDPRRHAVTVCFVAEFDEDAEPVARGGRAREFRWFDGKDLPADGALWPGTRRMLDHMPRGGADVEVLLGQYEALNARHVSHNELMWSTPALALTAIAFLWTIALGDGNEAWARLLAAVTSAVLSLVCLQLMAKHSTQEIRDAENLHRIERALGMLPVHRKPVPAARRGSSREPFLQSRLKRFRSRAWWMRALAFLGLASLAVAVVAVVQLAR